MFYTGLLVCLSGDSEAPSGLYRTLSGSVCLVTVKLSVFYTGLLVCLVIVKLPVVCTGLCLDLSVCSEALSGLYRTLDLSVSL